MKAENCGAERRPGVTTIFSFDDLDSRPGQAPQISAARRPSLRPVDDFPVPGGRFAPAFAADLRAGSTHLWLLRTGAEVDRIATALRIVLSPDERARNERFADAGARLSHLAGRALLRNVLSLYAEVSPQAWRFRSNAHGRPFVAREDAGFDLTFNLSHADGLVALVVANGADVGVDVETADRLFDVDDLVPHVCSAEEAAALAGAPPDRRRALFLDAWTLKEAYLKARGVGLSGDMRSCAFELVEAPADEAFGALRLDGGGDWVFARRRPSPRHLLAIARRGRWNGLRTIAARLG